MYDFEIREQHDEDAHASDYHDSHHGFPIARYWDDDFFSFVRARYSEGDRVLDLGCGPGSHWDYWRRLPSPGCLVGVDLSSEMIADARRRHPDGDFRQGRAHELPFEAGSFDLVIASSVLHHIPDSHLRGGLEEIYRVLDEHGRMVGREPSQAGVFGSASGWLSGAIMNFRHLVFRLTASREYVQPELGEHHHPLDADALEGAMSGLLRITQLESRFPFSSYVLRVQSEAVAALARSLDGRLFDRLGTMFYYAAHKNYVTEADVQRSVRLAREQEGSALSDEEFLAYLEAAARHVEELFGAARR